MSEQEIFISNKKNSFYLFLQNLSSLTALQALVRIPGWKFLFIKNLSAFNSFEKPFSVKKKKKGKFLFSLAYISPERAVDRLKEICRLAGPRDICAPCDCTYRPMTAAVYRNVRKGTTRPTKKKYPNKTQQGKKRQLNFQKFLFFIAM